MELTEKQEKALLRALKGQSELWVHPSIYPQLPIKFRVIAKISGYLEVNTMIVFDKDQYLTRKPICLVKDEWKLMDGIAPMHLEPLNGVTS
jgi:hypothetical protein